MEQDGGETAGETLPITLKQLKPLLLPRACPSVQGILSASSLSKSCRERGVYTKDMGWTATTAKYRRRLVQHDRGTLQYDQMTAQKLHGIASSRLIDPGIDTQEDETYRTQLIALLRKDDDVKRPKPVKVLSLPPELRNTIYEILLIDSGHVLVLPDMPSLLHVNQQIRKEASAVFFGSNNFFLPAYAINKSEPFNKYEDVMFTEDPSITYGNIRKWINMLDYGLFSTKLSLTIHSQSMCIYINRYIAGFNLFAVELDCSNKTYVLLFLGQFDLEEDSTLERDERQNIVAKVHQRRVKNSSRLRRTTSLNLAPLQIVELLQTFCES